MFFLKVYDIPYRIPLSSFFKHGFTMVSLKTRSRSQEMHRGLLEDPLLVLGAANGHPVQRGDDHLLYAQ